MNIPFHKIKKRIISVTTALSRLYGRILGVPIEEYYKENGEEQCSSRAEGSNTDKVFSSKNNIEKRSARHLETYFTIVELQTV